MKFAEPTRLHRKSGMWGTRRSWLGQRVKGEVWLIRAWLLWYLTCREQPVIGGKGRG
jgi:hypothetical protein